jgi:ribose transport system substrate-binding protein
MRNIWRKWVVAASVATLSAAAVAGCGGDSGGGGGAAAADGGTKAAAVKTCPGTRPSADEKAVTATAPDGSQGVHGSTIELTQAEIDKLKSSGRTYKVATFWQAQGDNETNMRAGIKATFAKYGLPIEITAEAAANWDAARQSDQIQTLVKTKPDAMIGILVDQDAVAPAIRAANEAKVPVIFWDVPAKGADFSAIVSSHGQVAGWKAADELAKAIGCKGDVAVMPMKFKFFPTDERVKGFLERIKTYPDIHVVTQQGATVFDDGEKAGQGILQRFPKLAGAFASWQEPAMGYISAAKTLGKTDVALTTVDLGEQPALELATCGMLKATVTQLPYDEGVAEALDTAKLLAGSEVPGFAVTDVPTVTHDNVFEAYKQVFHKDPPKQLIDAYKKTC